MKKVYLLVAILAVGVLHICVIYHSLLKSGIITTQKSHMDTSMCAALFASNTTTQRRVQELERSVVTSVLPDTYFAQFNCMTHIKEQDYVLRSTKEEEDFPIAFSIVVYKDLGQVEQLLRAIYRPNNSYCFHLDSKAALSFKNGLKKLASCFPNVIIASKSINVIWGSWPVLEADLVCMKDLLAFSLKWKYLINLTGHEFPLRTNMELVRILKVLNGTNIMEGSVKTIPKIRIPKGNPGFNVSV